MDRLDLDKLNRNAQNCMVGHLGIEVTERCDEYICGKMPVDNRTRQPYGLLHGGASVVLAETLGSYGSGFLADLSKENVVGLEINANHVRSATEGYVYGKATIIHKGKRTHIWDIRITDEEDRLVCISRLTVAIVEKK
jgi:1,4-dihydroxy-2-naphthoyl-CoA hydrolase